MMNIYAKVERKILELIADETDGKVTDMIGILEICKNIILVDSGRNIYKKAVGLKIDD